MALERRAPWRWGALEVLPLPPWLRLVLELLVLDALVYLLHRAYHRIPVLWRFHQVHHTDLDLDVTSASRFHAGEVLVSSAAKLVVVALLGISPFGLISFETAMLLAAQFQHANVSLPAAMERPLWWVLVPPAMHRIHHYPARAETDSNFGTILPLWDRLFGTFRSEPRPVSSFGLPEHRDERRLGLPALLTMPFKS
jgi:sterol desaturase/sphingolipid hydroxylase (fatty acid hydroxylase superfamily)